MNDKEKAVRDAAEKLSDAIVSAREAGFDVYWPRRFEDLATININETARVAPVTAPVPVMEQPAPVHLPLSEQPKPVIRDRT